MRLAFLCALALWAGAALVLAEFRWFHRPSLAERLRPYSTIGAGDASSRGAASLLEALVPLASSAGERLARLLGVPEPLATRLERLHDARTPTDFRLREVGWSVGATALAALVSLVGHVPAFVALLALLGAPLLAFCLCEQSLAGRSKERQERLARELPVVAEQIGMLVSAGYSLGGAINHVAERGNGVTADDLRRVQLRISHGVGPAAALREWSALAAVPAVERLVNVLTLEGEITDLGQLVSEEARAIRQEHHRSLIGAIERRAQLVWIPVTVATLVPGVIFVAIPFLQALRLFTER